MAVFEVYPKFSLKPTRTIGATWTAADRTAFKAELQRLIESVGGTVLSWHEHTEDPKTRRLSEDEPIVIPKLVARVEADEASVRPLAAAIEAWVKARAGKLAPGEWDGVVKIGTDFRHRISDIGVSRG